VTVLRGTGIWSGELRFKRDRAAAVAAAVELDELGFDALWIPGGTGTGLPLFDVAAELLDATRRATVATGILSIWVQDAQSAAAGHERLHDAYGARFLLGLGISHAAFVEGEAADALLNRPRTAMLRYLDALDAAAGTDLSGERVLAALGPRMLELARDRSAGAHPYFVTPEHTRFAREALGDGPLLAPEQAVVLERDPARAREIARAHMDVYLGLPNYTNNLLRFGFTEDDLRDGGSDRLVDAVVCWGDEDAVRARVDEHRAAGADHVTLQVLSGRRGDLPLPEWRRLAAALLD
jgi:probable F420-dependent oxidoreductase